jgi:hypothetical protein
MKDFFNWLQEQDLSAALQGSPSPMLSKFGQPSEDVDEREIDALYDKARIAVKLVKEMRPNLLNNISTIANLSSGAYGLYNSGENEKQLPPDIERWLVYGGVRKEDAGKIPAIVYKKHGVDPNAITISDKIHINVARILKESTSDLEAVKKIASVIVHEAVHAQETELSGATQETSPKTAQHRFEQEFDNRIPQILQQYPELGSSGMQPS